MMIVPDADVIFGPVSEAQPSAGDGASSTMVPGHTARDDG